MRITLPSTRKASFPAVFQLAPMREYSNQKRPTRRGGGEGERRKTDCAANSHDFGVVQVDVGLMSAPLSRAFFYPVFLTHYDWMSEKGADHGEGNRAQPAL